MKKLITILLCIGLIACNDITNVNKQKTGIHLSNSEDYELEIIVLDSCQYYYKYGSVGFLTHKGNCKNPIHPENKIK